MKDLEKNKSPINLDRNVFKWGCLFVSIPIGVFILLLGYRVFMELC
ncbi:hypothetical protein [Fusobacterium ulcerans]|nr:hypothetical protein [Fusobacterium ulcerans]